MPTDPLPWQRRMFASVDIIGSTSFKQRYSEDSGRWAGTFKLFFDEFPTTLRACFENVEGSPDGKPASPMRVWKFIGDEILFATELTRHEEVAHHMLAFKDAINEYSNQLKKKRDLSLALKGTMWGAGFPVTNAEVTPILGDGTSTPNDYLGPCIDQGFRLCAHADARRIPVSVDLAYMVARTGLASNVPLVFQCDEPKSHKGVSYLYPHICLDRLNEERSAEDKILNRREPVNLHDLQTYLEEIYQKGTLFKPFIISDPSRNFNQPPDWMVETRDNMLRTAAESAYHGTESAASGTKTQPPPPQLPQERKANRTKPANGGQEK